VFVCVWTPHPTKMHISSYGFKLYMRIQTNRHNRLEDTRTKLIHWNLILQHEKIVYHVYLMSSLC